MTTAAKPKSVSKRRTTIYFPPEELRWLRRQAWDEQRTMGELIVDALHLYRKQRTHEAHPAQEKRSS
jgi:hypothetical protein